MAQKIIAIILLSLFRFQKLDDYVQAENIKNIVLIKADVEGAEGLVINGGLELIKRDMPTIILEISDEFCQRLGYRADDIFTTLKTLGYQSLAYQTEGDFKVT